MSLRIAVKTTLSVMASQAKLDAQVEGSKACIPPTVSLASIFALLDTQRQDYVTDLDLLHFVELMGLALPIDALTSLVRSVSQEVNAAAPRLSLRELGTLIFPQHSPEHQLMFEVGSDVEAQFLLETAIQAPGAPAVPLHVQRQIALLIVEAALATAELQTALAEFDRLALDAKALGRVFTHIAGGDTVLSESDMRSAFVAYGFPSVDVEFLWRRYVHVNAEYVDGEFLAARHGMRKMRFSEFRAQLEVA